ncbi:MAG: hypothetical protein R3335_10440, partial [Anaerolineales bacterium]|nr:hypothetical protein [Anaerolineales bacterium]
TDSSPPASQPRSITLIIAQVLWIALAVLLVIMTIAGLPLRFEELATVCTSEPCAPQTLNPVDAAALRELGLSFLFYGWFHTLIEAVVGTVYTLLAFLIFWRKSGEWIGILISSAILLFGLNFMLEADSALVAAYPAIKVPHTFLTLIATLLLFLLLFLFPDGRFIPGWTRWVAIGMAVVIAADPFFIWLGLTTPSGQFSLVLTALLLPCLFVGVGAQVYRYRSISSPAERQQTKWVVFGFTGLVAIMIIWALLVDLIPLQPGLPRLIFNLPVYVLLGIILVSFPFTVVFSILRYRLWDIDVIIRRTLVYGLLTGLIVVIYFGLVVLLQSLVTAVGGQQSTIAIVVSTLAIAALVNPLRGRIQTFIDRRFYRQRYDGERALAAFGMTVRDEVDLENLTKALLDLIDETMQPESVTVWLRERPE